MKAYWLGQIFCISLLFLRCSCFNVDVVTARTFSTPSAPGSYFGYDISLHSPDISSKWLLVGAPLENVTILNGERQQRGGVYKCNAKPSANEKCQIIQIDNEVEGKDEVKRGQWLGGSLYSTSKRILACAPRYLRYHIKDKKRRSYLNGKCFNLLLSQPPRYDNFDPCLQETSSCQAGFSAQLTDTHQPVLGTVGRSQWEGGVVTKQNNGKPKFSTKDQIDMGDYMGYSVAYGHFTAPDKTEFVGGAPRGDLNKGKVLIYGGTGPGLQVLSQLPQPKNLQFGSYFGSVVCAVDLNSDSFTDILVGAPQYSDNQDEGRVFVYINNKQGAVNQIESMTLMGDNTKGAQFGSSIATVGDLNKDGFQDVVVGAPFDGPNQHGAVFIYFGTRDGIENKYRQKILAYDLEKGGTRLLNFGSSITGGVDVDDNKYSDIAVGAFGSDKVVLFRTRRIIDVKPTIKLSSKEIVLENNATLCRDPSDNNKEHKCINITVQFKFEDKEAGSAKALDLLYSITLDKEQGNFGRMYFVEKNSPKGSIKDKSCTLHTQRVPGCNRFHTIYLKDKNQILDKLSDLTILLHYDIKPKANCKTDLCPILNDYTPNQIKKEVLFVKECGGSQCNPNLVISSTVETGAVDSQNKPLLKIGAFNEMKLKVVVENRNADAAYRTRVLIKHPAGIEYVGLQNQGIHCDNVAPSNGTGTITCDVGNPLGGHKNKTFKVIFSISEKHSAQKELAGKDNKFKIELETTSVNKDVHEKDNKQEVLIRVKFEAELAASGRLDRDEVFYRVDESAGKSPLPRYDFGSLVVQTFTITNNGPSSLDAFEVDFALPFAHLVKVEITGIFGTCNNNQTKSDAINSTAVRRRRRASSGTEELNCNRLTHDPTACVRFSCQMGLLKKEQRMEIKITQRVLLEKSDPKRVNLKSKAEVKIPQNFRNENHNDTDATTLLKVIPPPVSEKKTVPVWIYIVSAVAGSFLLGLATFFMCRRGWFKRKRYREISGPTQQGEMPVVYKNMSAE